MISILLDGEKIELEEGKSLREILPDMDPLLCVAVICPGKISSESTRNYLVKTSAGDVVIETEEDSNHFFSAEKLLSQGIHWHDRKSVHFGPFSADFSPARKVFRYERGDLVIGCGGYDPGHSYFVFVKTGHSADHGAPENGGVIGRVVSGRGVVDRLTENDTIDGIEPVFTFEDSTASFTTTDYSIVPEQDMQIITHVKINAQGYSEGGCSDAVAKSVEHMLLSLRKEEFWTSLSSSTYIRDDALSGSSVPFEVSMPRGEGSVMLRTAGKLQGSVYIYTQDLPRSLSHTLVGQVVHGIELAKIAGKGDRFAVKVSPEKFDLIGVLLDDARKTAAERGITFEADSEDGERMVVAQNPKTTLEVLSKGSVSVETIPLDSVIDIELDDENAYNTCRIFRDVSGLKFHDVGRLPMLFSFDDVYLFSVKVPKKTNINPENVPDDGSEVPAGVLAMTNDSRKGAGIAGVRTEPNSEFGPTSEPFSGTNVIGRVLEPAKLKSLKEGDTVYFREVGS